MAKSTFSRGSGRFKCRSCGKSTRDTGDNGSCRLCPLCYEISTLENSLSDNGWGKHGDLEDCKTVAEAVAKFESLRKAANLAIRTVGDALTSECAAYAEGTPFRGQDFARVYNQYADECSTGVLSFKNWCESRLPKHV